MRAIMFAMFAGAAIVSLVVGCVEDEATSEISAQRLEVGSTAQINEERLSALGPDEHLVMDLNEPANFVVENEQAQLDFSRIDVRTREGQTILLSDWLGGDTPAGTTVIENENSATGPVVVNLSPTSTFNLPANATRCFDIGWVPSGASIAMFVQASPVKARLLVRRRLTLSSSWEGRFHPSSAFSYNYPLGSVNLFGGGYHQVCLESASTTKSTGINLVTSAPQACP